MNKVIHGHGTCKSVSWHAEMPYVQKPRIRKRFKVIEGIKYYLGFGTDKIYRADLFDKTFG